VNPIDWSADDELQAWVDGRLPDDRQAGFAERLRLDLDAAARASAYRAQAEAMNAALHAKFGASTAERLRARAIASAVRRRQQLQSAQAAAVAAALLVGGGVGSIVTRLSDRTPALAQTRVAIDAFEAEAITAHLTYTIDMRHPVEIGANDQAHLLQWLSNRLGKTLVAPDFADLGYNLIGRRLLPAGEGPAGQLMYEDETGKRITVYLRGDPASRETAFEFAEGAGVNGFRWADRGFGYAIFGDVDHGALLHIAEAVYRQIAAS
jgi:anti-sigma factor RsiW